MFAQTQQPSRLSHYLRLMRFDKPIGIFLLLWPTLWALWIAAKGIPNIGVLIIFILGTIIMRAAGCVINDVADRHFDRHVERTKARPLAAGDINVKAALVLFVALCLFAFGLVLLLNRLTILMSFVGVLVAAIYPFTKRVTHLPQLVLGVAFAWGIPMSFAAVTNTVPPMAWVLFVASALWTVAYDTQYAMADREDDVLIGIKSTAILFGRFDRLIIGLLQCMVLALLLWVGWHLQLSLWFYLGLMAANALVIYQQILIRECKPSMCFRAFLNNHWFGLVVFLGFALGF